MHELAELVVVETAAVRPAVRQQRGRPHVPGRLQQEGVRVESAGNAAHAPSTCVSCGRLSSCPLRSPAA